MFNWWEHVRKLQGYNNEEKILESLSYKLPKYIYTELKKLNEADKCKNCWGLVDLGVGVNNSIVVAFGFASIESMKLFVIC